jgi:PHD/YefM family antitoxin component YafN of YafNO toxin-antitoxin module
MRMRTKNMATQELGEIEAVGHAELRSNLRKVVGKLHQDRPVAVTNRNRVEAYLVSPTEFGRLADAEEQLDRLRSTLPILVAAVRSHAAYPAEALRALIGSDLSIDWRVMNAFQASMPTETTHDEDGRLLPRQAHNLHHEPVAELDEELVYG